MSFRFCTMCLPFLFSLVTTGNKRGGWGKTPQIVGEDQDVSGMFYGSQKPTSPTSQRIWLIALGV